MTHYLQSVLDIDNSLLTTGLARLEKSTGNSGVDTRLIADILEKSHTIMRKLNLDTSDTTARELYQALKSAIKTKDGELIFLDTDYVLYVVDKRVISFNLIDIIENSHHELPFEDQIVSHGRRSLQGEIIGRYIDHSRTDETTTLEIASSVGLLLEQDTQDACYNSERYNKK